MADLLELKKALSNPKTAAQAAAKIQSFNPTDPNQNISDQTRQVDVETEADTLQRLLGKAPEPKIDKADTVERLIERVVSPYITKDVSPQYQALIDVIEKTISQFLRTLLQRQDFKSLESLWRATEALVNEEYMDEQRFFLIDNSQAELIAAVNVSNVLSPQLSIGQIDSADIVIEVTSRDDIPLPLLGLQHLYCTRPLRDAIFGILKELAPIQTDVSRLASYRSTRDGPAWISGRFGC